MTRVQKNKSKYNINNFLNIIKKIIENIIYFVIGLSYMITSSIRSVDTIIAIIFMKLPRVIRSTFIYIVLGIALTSILQQPNEIVIYKDKIIEESIKVEIVQQEEKVLALNENMCVLSDIECKIISKAKEIGLSNEQAYIVVSISKHETGNWTSSAFRNKNNLGGIMCNTGLRTYNSLDEGIEAFVTLLKNRYFDKGLDTIEKIGPVYCPIGADNDPHNLNQYWIPNVTKYYNSYLTG